MPDIITAPITREIVSYGLSRCQDIERNKFSTDEELFDYINIVLRDLARHSKLLKSDCYIPLVPNKMEYDYLSLIDRAINILQVETISLVDENNVESSPLTFVNKTTFRKDTSLDTSISSANYYTFDGVNLAYWRPSGSLHNRLKLRVARELQTAEEVSKEIDPPIALVAKYLTYIKYGLVKEMALGRPDDKELLQIQPLYERLYSGYTSVELVPKTLDTHRTRMQEF